MSALAGKVAQTPDGYRLISLQGLEWLERVPTTARCLFCPDTFEGTAAEAKLWGTTHRAANHPAGVTPSPKERRAAAKAARSQHSFAGWKE